MKDCSLTRKVWMSKISGKLHKWIVSEVCRFENSMKFLTKALQSAAVRADFDRCLMTIG